MTRHTDSHDDANRSMLEAIQRDIGLLAQGMIGLRKNSSDAATRLAQLQAELAEMKSLLAAISDRR